MKIADSDGRDLELFLNVANLFWLFGHAHAPQNKERGTKPRALVAGNDWPG
jgi:hypothetical protein